MGRVGGNVSFPTKFVPGKIEHRGYNIDASGRVLPVWKNPLDPFQLDPATLQYRPLDLGYPHAGPPPERSQTPPAPPVWETDEMIQALMQMLHSMGFRTSASAALGDIKRDKLGNENQVGISRFLSAH